MNHKVYMHAINSKDYTYFKSQAEIQNLEHILQDGKLKSLRLQGYDENYDYGYNGLDYISLCDFEKRNLYPEFLPKYNSYQSYIKYGISLAFDKQKLEVIEPIILEPYSDFSKGRGRINKLGLSEKRYTDLMDEVQVKNEISLDKLLYITYPVSKLFDNSFYFSKNAKLKLLKHEIDDIRKILNYYKFDNVQIYDIDSELLLDDEGINKLIFKI